MSSRARAFPRYQLTAYPFADPGLHRQMRELLSLDATRRSPLLKRPYVTLSRPFRDGAAVPLWLVGRRCDNYEAVLETADLSRRGSGQRKTLLQRMTDADSAIRFWAVTGLVILECAEQAVVDALTGALNDPAVSVRIAAADGLFRLRRYATGLPALTAALEHPLPVARGRAANVLDSQPPSAADHLRPALEPLRQTIARMGDSVQDVQYRFPMERAVAAIEGSTAHYRWSDDQPDAV